MIGGLERVMIRWCSVTVRVLSKENKLYLEWKGSSQCLDQMGYGLVKFNYCDSEPCFFSKLEFHIERWIKGQIVSFGQYATIGSQFKQTNLISLLFTLFAVFTLISANYHPTQQHLQLQNSLFFLCFMHVNIWHYTKRNHYLSPCVALWATALSW